MEDNKILAILFLGIMLILFYYIGKSSNNKIPYIENTISRRQTKSLSPPPQMLDASVNEYSGSKYMRDLIDIPRNPVLKYQAKTSQGRNPVVLGDPIIPKMYTGPNDGSFYKAYDNYQGPYPGKALNIPVPQGSLKTYSEEYKYPFYYQKKPLEPYDYFKPYGPNSSSMQSSLAGGYADDPYYTRGISSSLNYTGDGAIPFIGSVSSYAPFAEVQTPWEKAGILTSLNKIGEDKIMNVYRRPIAPVNNIFDYMAQDKDGFMIPVKRDYLDDGDVIDHIVGKGGPWKVHIYVNNKYIWV